MNRAVPNLFVAFHWRLKFAVTDIFVETVTMHVRLVPEHPPLLHPVNTEPVAGVAVNVTAVPVSTFIWHVLPQFIPVGLLVTVPEPLPFLYTFRILVPVDAGLTVTTALPDAEDAPRLS